MMCASNSEGRIEFVVSGLLGINKADLPNMRLTHLHCGIGMELSGIPLSRSLLKDSFQVLKSETYYQCGGLKSGRTLYVRSCEGISIEMTVSRLARLCSDVAALYASRVDFTRTTTLQLNLDPEQPKVHPSTHCLNTPDFQGIVVQNVGLRR